MIFTSDKAAKGFKECHQVLQDIAHDLDGFLNDCSEELIITSTKSTIEDDKRIGRKSVTHQQGRAIDIYTRNMDVFTINELIVYANRKYGHLGAIKDGKPRLIVYGDDRHKSHIHLQINRSYAV